MLLPSPYPHENQPSAARHHRRRSMPGWGWLLLGVTVGCASTVGWMVTGLDSRWHDQWQTVLRRVDDQTAQLDTHRQRLNHHAILLTESLHLLDQHTTAIAFHGRRLDAHADEFVARIAQLDAHATQLTAHQQLLHTQAQRRTQQATPWSRVQPAHAAGHPNGPPTLEIFAPLHTPASVAPAATRQIIRLPRDLGSVSRKGGQP